MTGGEEEEDFFFQKSSTAATEINSNQLTVSVFYPLSPSFSIFPNHQTFAFAVLSFLHLFPRFPSYIIAVVGTKIMENGENLEKRGRVKEEEDCF